MPSWKDTFPGNGMKKQATITKQQNKENVLIPSSLWVSKTDHSLGGMQCQQWRLTEGEVSLGLLQGLRSDSKKKFGLLLTGYEVYNSMLKPDQSHLNLNLFSLTS